MSRTKLYQDVHDLMENVEDMLVAWPKTVGNPGPVHRTLASNHINLCYIVKHIEWSDKQILEALTQIKSYTVEYMDVIDYTDEKSVAVWAINVWIYISIQQITRQENKYRKLARLMIEGAKMHLQGFHKAISYTAGEYYTCALGAAYVAFIGGNVDQAYNSIATFTVFTQLDIDPYEHFIHPVTNEITELYEIIMSLNDDYKWPRERIAGWIKTLAYAKDTNPN